MDQEVTYYITSCMDTQHDISMYYLHVYIMYTVQYSTVQYSTVQYSTVQYSTVHTCNLLEHVSS
jgi:hypothetical protein